MPAPKPTPQYISIDDVASYISEDKVAIGNVDPTYIPTELANTLIALGEGVVLQDLSPYYVTVPALITEAGGDWTTLPPYVYAELYNMFCYQAAYKLIGNFIARNTDETDRTLSYSQKYYMSEYNGWLNRINDKLPNGSFRYQIPGLKALSTGIPRRPNVYAIGGSIGAGNYSDHQFTDAAKNFSGNWPYRWKQ